MYVQQNIHTDTMQYVHPTVVINSELLLLLER